MSLSVVIPTYNGAHLLEEYLPDIIGEFGAQAVILVDDCSRDGSQELVAKRFPGIRFIDRRANGGFSAAVNDGIRAASSDYILLLNNDVRISPGFAEPLLQAMQDESVFAASPRIIVPRLGGIDEGAKTGYWHHGMFYTDQIQGVTQQREILYTTACAAIYRMWMLRELNGFDEAYSPFYWEDADLGYRAWKRGWTSVYVPECEVVHEHGASTSKSKSSYSDAVRARNGLFFIWRNIEHESLRRRHKMWLPLVAAKNMVAGNRAFKAGWDMARERSDECNLAREVDSQKRVLSDAEIFLRTGVGAR